MKECTSCHHYLSLKQFYRDRSRTDGTQSWCKDCHREYGRAWVAARRAEWLAEHGPCAVCGSWDNLEVDHKDRQQKISHKVWSWTLVRRSAELSKCWVLCHEHHVVKSVEVGDWKSPSHGTENMYRRHKCRCLECRAFYRKKNARRYIKEMPQ